MYEVRLAVLSDVPALKRLIDASARSLLHPYYDTATIGGALGGAFGVDRQLIDDATFFVAEGGTSLAGCGGWSKRRTLFGSDGLGGRDDALLDPAREPARLRAFFTDPARARTGVGRSILHACENAAAACGFSALELLATLAGERLYGAEGFIAGERLAIALPNGAALAVVRMAKQLAG